jgi:hypothetical protein
VLYDALLHLGYNGDVPVYRARMSMAHSMEQCEVSMTIPLNPTESWMATIIGVDLDDTVEQTAQVALTFLCGSRFADTAAIPIALFLARYQGEHMWQQRPQSISDPEGPHFHAAWLQWPSMLNTRSTCSTPPPGPSSSSACVWLLMKSATSTSHTSSRS